MDVQNKGNHCDTMSRCLMALFMILDSMDLITLLYALILDLTRKSNLPLPRLIMHEITGTL